jgi:hypothetical protein
MKHLRCSKKLFIRGGILLLLFMFLSASAPSSAQRMIKKKKLFKRDLTIKIVQCPKKVVKPGEDLGSGFQVIGSSTFPNPLKDIAVDLILTSKPTYPAPAPYAVYSPNYSDNVLLKGGREHISFTGPGKVNVPLNGTNTIPADTPSGNYYLGAVIDAGNKVKESSERNNVSFCKLRVVRLEVKRMPDLTIPSVTFEKVKKGTDASGNVYWIFNVIITVKNQGSAAAGPFKVLLERNVGPGGTYTQACQTCVLDVTGLAAGQSVTLPPRQFNNANNMNSIFRATADSLDTIVESNETNNMNAVTFKP